MDPSSVADLDDLFSEKSLFRIYRLAPSFFSNRFNTVVATSTFCLLACFSVAHICVPRLRDTVAIQFSDTFSSWANAGVSLAGTILGFLIAGFAILCTILRPETMLILHKLTNKTYGMSELKLLFVVFVDVFVQFLALLFWSVAVLVFGGKQGPAAVLGAQLARLHWLIPFCLLHAIFTLWGTWFVALILTLKSFIYNLYQSLLLSLADVVDEAQRKTKESSSGQDQSSANEHAG
jgi:hypothetical protein